MIVGASLGIDIRLSLEDFHNAGLTPEETKNVIEQIKDPTSGWCKTFKCYASGINRNWAIKTVDYCSMNVIVAILDEIEFELKKYLKKKKGSLKNEN